MDLVKVSLSRVNFLFLIFFCFVIIFSVKITYLSLSPLPNKIIFSEKANKNFIKKRGDILDRNGIILARNIDIYSAGVRPSLVKDKKKLLINLRLIFPELETHKIKLKLKKNKFFYIKKDLPKMKKLIFFC